MIEWRNTDASALSEGTPSPQLPQCSPMLNCPQVSAQRAREIVRDIAVASRPRGQFFVLLFTSSMIASFGLIANSTAVIIGAMLVSPLMTPIFGAALGMLRGNPRMLARALWSELAGVVLAVGAAYLVGLPQLAFSSATPEMLARTQPNLLDLFVAIFAGFAGAYALIDERVSPALPGVAIATAIVPPLSTCGLCLSIGAWSGARGAMLLFLANFVSILIVAVVTFGMGGLTRKRRQTARSVITQFGPTLTSFAVITIILTNSLIRIGRDRALEMAIADTLSGQLALQRGADLEESVYRITPRGVQVLATVRAHRTISPTWVESIERALETAIAQPVDLVVRTQRSRDVCALGSSFQVVHPDLDGVFLVPAPDDFVARESLATQVVREFFEDEPGFELTRIEYGLSQDDESVIVAYTNAIRRITQREILDLEQELQERFDDPTLHLFVRVNAARLRGRDGAILVEWSNVRAAGEENVARIPAIEHAIRNAVAGVSDSVPLRVHFNWSGERWRALVELIGGEAFSPEGVAAMRHSLPEVMAEEVELFVWRRSDFVVSEEGISDYEGLIESDTTRSRESLRELFRTTSSSPTITSDNEENDSLANIDTEGD